MSIRLRLTLLYSGILALTLVTFSLALYFTVSRVALAVVEETLVKEADRLVSAAHFAVDNISYRAYRFTDPQTYVQTLHADGQLADKTANLGEYVLPLSEAGWKHCREGEPWTEVVSTGTGRLLVYSRPVWNKSEPGDGEYAGVLQLARSLVEYDQSLATLRNILASGSLLATVVTFGAGWVLAGAALRPIQSITHTAQAIGAERDFSRRVTHTGPPDEVGQLTTTFNTMLTELQSAFQQLEQTLHVQRRFVADASHELRTPLTTLRGNLGLLEREPPISRDDRKAVLADCIEECDRLIRLTNSLLLLARADSGLALARVTVPLPALLEEVCRQARALAPGRSLACEASPNLAALGDRDALKQVLLILLDNAFKHTPAGAAVTLAASPAPNGQVAVRVSDTGPGIPADALPHLFERFFRVESSRTGPGAGLGLAIARELVEAQGGSLTVVSQVGEGSTFAVLLPRALE